MLTLIVLYVIIGFCFSKYAIWNDEKEGGRNLTSSEKGLMYRWFGYLWPVGLIGVIIYMIFVNKD